MRKISGRQNGFTLIELVVVIFIIALVSGILILRLPSVKHASQQNQAVSIKSALRLAREYAILHQQWVKLDITSDHLQFSVLDDPNALNAVFTPLGDESSFWQFSALADSSFSVELSNSGDMFANDIYFWPSGEVTPFTLMLTRGHEIMGIQVSDQGIQDQAQVGAT